MTDYHLVFQANSNSGFLSKESHSHKNEALSKREMFDDQTLFGN